MGLERDGGEERGTRGRSLEARGSVLQPPDRLPIAYRLPPIASPSHATLSGLILSHGSITNGMVPAVVPGPPPPSRRAVIESEMIARAASGDPDAQRALYDAHVDRVYRLAFRLAGDEDLARDFTQDAFVRAFQRLGEFRGESALGTWLHAITVSVSLNGLRKVKRLRTREAPLEHAESLGSTPRRADPDLRQRLYAAIDDLPKGYRTVFVMHDVEGFTHEEIATALGIQAGTSKAQLFRARARLREVLADFAGAWSA